MTAPALLRAHRPARGAQVPAPRVVAAVLELTLSLWFSDLARSLGSRTRARTVLVVLGAVLLGVAGWSLAQGAGAASGGDLLSPQGAAPLAGLLLTMPAVVTTLVLVYSPPRTLILEMLSVLPVGRAAVRAALWLLSGLLGLALSLVLLAALGQPVVGIVAVAPGAVVGILGLLVTGVLVAVVGNHVLALLLARVLRLPSLAAQAIAALLVTALAGAGLFQALPMNHHEPAGPHATISAPLLLATAGRAPLAAALPSLLLLVALLLGGTALAAVDGSSREAARAVSPVLARVLPARSAWRLELAQILRYPSNLVAVCLLNGIGLVGLGTVLAGGSDGLGLGAMLLLALSCWGVGAYGPTAPHHWIHRSLGAPTAWVWPKLGAVLVVWGASIAFHGTWLVLLTSWQPLDVLVMLPGLFVEIVLSCLVGVLLPVSTTNSLSGAMSEAAGLLTVLGVTMALQGMGLSLPNPLAGLALQLVTCAAVVLAYWALARHAALADDSV